MPYQAQAAAIVEQWRNVVAALVQAEPGSAQAAELQAEALRLRGEYQSLVRQAVNEYRSEPPPFPDREAR